MRKQPGKKNQGIYQIHGLNGCSNIIGKKNLKIICINIMIGGNAEKKKWVNSIAKVKMYRWADRYVWSEFKKLTLKCALKTGS